MTLRARWQRRGATTVVAHERAVRQAAFLFVVVGIIGLTTDFLPGAVGKGSKLLDLVNLAIGLAALTPLSARVSGHRALVFPLLAMGVVAANNAIGTIPAPTLGIWFVLIFLWIGSWYPRGTSMAMSPFAVAAYLAPYAAGAPRAPGSIGSVILIVPVAVLAGEILAANAQRAQQLAAEQQHAVNALAKANLTDDLTGLGNRRRGNQLLDTIEPGDAIAILDLDHFKAVNDQFGHAAGDRVLQELGEHLNAAIRGDDGVARMGGEEFIVIVRQPAPLHVHEVINRIVRSWQDREPLSTLSAGVAIHPVGRAPIDTYRAADAALYSAKAHGRNQTQVHTVG